MFTNHLPPEANKEARESIEEVTAHSLTLITNQTGLIFCEEEVSIVFINSTPTFAAITLVMVGWKLTIIFLFLQENAYKNPTTKRSLRMPKNKEVEVDKGSTPGATRELDFVSKTKSIIFTSTKKEFSQPPAFNDTETNTRSKIVLPHWGDLYSKIIHKDYPDFTPHSNLNVRILDDQVFPNIRRSYLHSMACWC
jgi:hypothetical protein